MRELFALTSRVTKLVKDFFAKEITADELRLGLKRIRDGAGPSDETSRKVKRKGTAEDLCLIKTNPVSLCNPQL
jgi:hypothetical protein